MCPRTAAGLFGGNPMILLPTLFAIFFFTIILRGPQRADKRRKEQESLMTGLKKR